MSDRKGFGNIEEIMDKQVNRTNYLLGIAIDDYQDCPKLNNAVRDVQDFIDLMKTQFAFEEENIDFLSNKAATGSNIIRKLDELSERLTSKDNLIIYFSGHGAMHPKHNKGYWIPIDGRQDDYFTYVPNTVVKDHLGSVNAHHIFLIADSCFSGALFTKGAKNVGRRLEKNPSRWGLTSGQKEIVLDGKPGENSPFATSLLKNLRKATRPIAVQELCLQVLEMTAANAIQTPLGEPLQVKGHENGQFVFRLKKDEIRDWAKAQKVGTIAAFQQFLAIYPNGQFAETAKTKIYNLKAENVWKRIKNSTKSLDFARFKRQFPKSEYAAEAERLLPIIEEDEEWRAAKEANKITRYERYLRLYETGRYRKEAIATINAILDTEKPKEQYQKTPVVIPTKTTGQESKPKTPSKPIVDWQNLPWKQIGIAAMILIVIIALANSGIFSPEPEESAEEIRATVEQGEEEAIEENETEEAAIEQTKPVVEEPARTSDPFAGQMKPIPSGTFQMGSNENDDEKPIHSVTINSFYMSKYEVTQKQWRDIMGTNPSHFKNCDKCPVENVSWNDIQEFIKKLNTKTGKNYRLPTEAEWEYAARGGQNYKYAGSNNLGNVAWYYDNSYDLGQEHKNYGTNPVGQKSPNGYGLYDMSGNVWEWCQDIWHENYNNAPANGTAWLTGGDNSRRVLRGGSWRYVDYDCRVAARLRYYPTYRNLNLGFRLARGI